MLCGLVALALAVWALLYNELLLGLLDPTPPLRPLTAAAIRRVQAGLVLAALAIGWIAWRGLARPPLARLAARWWAPRVLLVCSVVVLPLLLLEVSLRPFVDILGRSTRIFMPDPDRGWALRPGSTDLWGGVPITINAEGLRGPSRGHPKPPGTYRVLFLGDSVTFGYRIARDEETFPAVVERRLAERWQAPVEAINAGVGGYSPWQERLFLADEGLRYEPDLVVLGFVLNDVTEKLRLVRFGGTDEGHQLASMTLTLFDRLANASSIVYFLRELQARRLFGGDVQRGARDREVFEVETLVRDPYDPEIQAAWTLTLDNLGGLVDLCARHDLPLLLVVFPFTFQFEDPAALGVPQSILLDFARTRQVPSVDLLPRLGQMLNRDGRVPTDYFFDVDHPTPAGSRVIAEIITQTIVERWPDPARLGGS